MKRFFGIDLIKVLAVIFVIGVHFSRSTNFYEVPIDGPNMIVQLILRWVFIICVPLFLLVTGYLQVNKKVEAKYYKRLLPIIGIYLLYSILSILVRHFILNDYKTPSEWLFEILAFKANEYAWYINMYIGLFLFIPFLNLIVNNLKSKKEYLILLGTLAVIAAIPTFANSMFPLVSLLQYFRWPDWWILLYPIFYYFTGAYIRIYEPSFRKIYLIFALILTISIQTILTLFVSIHSIFKNPIGEYGSILIAIESILFFLLLYRINSRNNLTKKLLGFISILTLDIYLASYIVDLITYDYLMNNVYESQQQIFYFFPVIIPLIVLFSIIIGLIRWSCTELIGSIAQKLGFSKTSSLV